LLLPISRNAKRPLGIWDCSRSKEKKQLSILLK
jgi:hypothetical protein